MASIEFTDSSGVARVLSNQYPVRPGRQLLGFVPSARPIGPTRVRPGSGIVRRYRHRTDHLASFTIPGLAPSQLEIAQQLCLHLLNGESATLVTDDAADRRYTIRLAPDTEPSISGPDDKYEYAFSMTALNTALAPMLCVYGPAALIMHAGDGLTAFSRASSAWYLAGASASALTQVGNNVPRNNYYIGGRRMLLIEGQRTNLVENSDVESAITGWGSQGGAAVTRDTRIARHASAAADIVTTNVADSGFYLHRLTGGSDNFPVAAGVLVSLTVPIWAEAGGAGKTLIPRLDWRDGTNTTISRSSGAPVVLVAGWNILTVTATSPGGTVGVFPLVHTDGAQGVFALWADVPNLEVAPAPSSPIASGSGAVARAAEFARVSLPFGPQAMWIYHRFVELGTIAINGARAWQLGVSGQAGLLMFRSAAGSYAFRHVNAVTQTEVAFAASPAIGDVVEHLAVLNPDGRPDIYQSVNGGALASVVGGGSAIGFASAWSSSDLWIGTAPSADTGFAAHERLVVGRGTGMDLVTARGIAG